MLGVAWSAREWVWGEVVFWGWLCGMVYFLYFGCFNVDGLCFWVERLICLCRTVFLGVFGFFRNFVAEACCPYVSL